MSTNAPRANHDPAEVARKRSALDEPHVAPLTNFVRQLRAERGGGEAVPWIDPTEAGIGASILILLEAPGPRAVGRDGGPDRPGSGFVSPDNDDQTAQNMWGILRDAGVDRTTEIVTWNIVPWYVGDGSRIRAVNEADRNEARPALLAFLGLLPDLRVVVLLGRAAARGWHAAGPRRLPAIEAPHPSPRVLNMRPPARRQIVQALCEARSVANLPHAGSPDAGSSLSLSQSGDVPPHRSAGTGPPIQDPAPEVEPCAQSIVRAYHEGERLRLRALADRFSLTTQEAERVLWEWEPRVYPRLRLRAEPEDVVAAREGLLAPSRLLDRDYPRLRWERIAYRAGVSVAEARALYERLEGHGAAQRSYTGRGRRFEGMEP